MRNAGMTLDEIKQCYLHEWVLIEFTALDEELKIVEGQVLAHSPSRDDIDQQLMAFKNEKIAIEFTGEADVAEAYLL
jgi:hypothetical protein